MLGHCTLFKYSNNAYDIGTLPKYSDTGTLGKYSNNNQDIWTLSECFNYIWDFGEGPKISVTFVTLGYLPNVPMRRHFTNCRAEVLLLIVFHKSIFETLATVEGRS